MISHPLAMGELPPTTRSGTAQHKNKLPVQAAHVPREHPSHATAHRPYSTTLPTSLSLPGTRVLHVRPSPGRPK